MQLLRVCSGGSFDYDKDLIESLSKSVIDVNAFIGSLNSPGKRYYIRVNVLKISPGELYDRLRGYGLKVFFDEVLEEALWFPVEGPYNVKDVGRYVFVDKRTAESVFVGANVYAPGVVKAKGIRRGDIVNVVGPKGIIVAEGEAVVNGEEMEKMKKGLAIRVYKSCYRLPKLRELDEYAYGYFYEQSFPAILTTHVLDPKPGDIVIDMCAAPGGKTSHIVEYTSGKARVLAFDHSKSKIKRLQETLARLGHDGLVEVFKADSRYLDIDFPWIKADKVLLDPPCTSLGVRPKIYDEKKYIDVVNNARYQRQFIKVAYKILKPGGILVYSTCTVTLEENEENIAYAEKIGFKVIEVERIVGSNGKGKHYFNDMVLRFYPHIHDVTGYFIAKLIKI